MCDTMTVLVLTRLAAKLTTVTDCLKVAANGGHPYLDIRPELAQAVSIGRECGLPVSHGQLASMLSECSSAAKRALNTCGDEPALFGDDAFHVCSAALKAERLIAKLLAST